MKKKLLLVLLVLCLMPMLMGAATEKEAVLEVSAIVQGMEIHAATVEGETYLFLPAHANTRELSLRFKINGTEAELVTISGPYGTVQLTESFNLKKITSEGKEGELVFSVIADGVQKRITVLQGDSIPSLYLTSDSLEENREWVDASKINKTTGSMVLLTADGKTIYDGNLTQIKARGNSTFKNYPKKAYQIKLDKKTDLLGNGEKVKTWVLLANYGDATLIHDKFFKDFASELEMPYTASCNWVNLYYDGEYRGVYLLSEKVSVGSDAVDITDMEKLYEELNETYGNDVEVAVGVNAYGQKIQYTVGLVEPENVTGGWVIEKFKNTYDEVSGFITAQNVGFNVKSPEWAGREAMEYISEYYQEFENAVYATDENGNYTGYNAETGKYYYEYCDLESLVQTYLIQQFSLNIDAYWTSFYFYKDVDGIMYAGPVWDMDNTCGTGWDEEIAPNRDYVSNYRYLAKPLSQNEHFLSAVEEYYTNTFAPMVKELLQQDSTIDTYIETLSPNAAMNYKLWPYVRVGDPKNENHLWTGTVSYSIVTDDMKTWMKARLAVLDKRFENKAYKALADVTDHWAYNAVRFAIQEGLLKGISETRFDPEGTATRGMLCTVLARLDGQDTTPKEGQNWMQPGLAWAVENGISDGSDPEAPITRQQLATMLWRYEGKPEGQGSLAGYTDSASISDWATEAMEWAVGQGIFKGNGAGALNPEGKATRAEIAQVLMNYLND